MDHQYSYQSALAAAERIRWRVEDIIDGDKCLDFEKPFLPEALARVEPLRFLTPEERRTLNQIRGNAYLCIFGLVEEFILPFVLDHARTNLQGDDYRVRALLQFATEEAKHIQLFKRFRADFERGFSTRCEVIGPPQEIARAVLSHQPLAVAITNLHIEWFTHAHYVESVKDSQDLDPQFKSLLRHHWMEEAQHAKLDTLIVESLAGTCTDQEVERAIDEYIEIAGMLDGGLQQQTKFDLDALCRKTGRCLSDSEQEQFTAVQLQANRFTYLGSGMTHPNVLATLKKLSPSGRRRIEELAPLFS